MTFIFQNNYKTQVKSYECMRLSLRWLSCTEAQKCCEALLFLTTSFEKPTSQIWKRMISLPPHYDVIHLTVVSQNFHWITFSMSSILSIFPIHGTNIHFLYSVFALSSKSSTNFWNRIFMFRLKKYI